MKLFPVILCLFVLCIICLPSCDDCTCTVGTKTLSLKPNASEGKDAALGTGEPNTNYGSHPEFSALAWTCGGSPCRIRSLLQFDLSDIPDGAKIMDAKLSLYSWDSPSNGSHSTQSGSNQTFLQRITESWSENTVTWNNAPSVTTVNQVVLPASSSSIQHYEDIDVTDLVQDMVDDPENSYGFFIRLSTEEEFRKMIFASSDNPDAGLHPKLEVEYQE